MKTSLKEGMENMPFPIQYWYNVAAPSPLSETRAEPLRMPKSIALSERRVLGTFAINLPTYVSLGHRGEVLHLILQSTYKP